MRILTTGKGSSGSWQVRGAQLGGAAGEVIKQASRSQIESAHAVVYVKRLTPDFLHCVRKAKTPWIWDLVDFYPQPGASFWNQNEACSWVRQQILKAKPTGVIYPTQKMRQDIGIPGVTIYHHARPETKLNSLRKEVKVIGYEGAVKYLGNWGKVIQKECSKRGWTFRTDIPVSQMDIVLALRDQPYNGYVQRNWKSNVKLANAHAAGTPFVGFQECGYTETATGHERFVISKEQLSQAFDDLEDFETRKEVQSAFIKNTITVESCAAEVVQYVEALLRDQ